MVKARRISTDKSLRAYIIGIALGDGNLSNPNSRATRLRVTCDTRYPRLVRHISTHIKKLLPDNKVSLIARTKTYADISCYSNHWEHLLQWRVGEGSKIKQSVSIPKWIKDNRQYTKHCLRGLLQTDGSRYIDRGYTMVNFTNSAERLARDVFSMMQSLGYKPNLQQFKTANGNVKYTVRLARDTSRFIKDIRYWKA